jgi:putative oxidoreductase
MVSKSRLYIPALGETYESLAPYAELLLRAGFVELVGGICIAIGFLTRPFALLCLIEMIVIALKAHLPNGWLFTVPGGGGEFPVMWAILFLIILIRGGGPYSVDRAIGKEF